MVNKLQRHALKRPMKEKVSKRVGQTADLMMQLDMLLFLQQLAEEARSKAFEEKTATIRAQHFKASTKKILKKVRG
ncbi:centromere protein W [Engraulis encrasicolus]|uniref:centromere protein W n=1 Tax=Engraulis encrasicolus TaxID=184585 RepID=UPI002FD2631C